MPISITLSFHMLFFLLSCFGFIKTNKTTASSAVIKFIYKKGLLPSHNKNYTSMSESAYSYQKIKNWSRDFKLGKEFCKYPLTFPKIADTKENINLLHNMMLIDLRKRSCVLKSLHGTNVRRNSSASLKRRQR